MVCVQTCVLSVITSVCSVYLYCAVCHGGWLLGHIPSHVCDWLLMIDHPCINRSVTI